MAKSDNLHIRVSPEIKAEADILFNSMGMTTTDAINIFLKQAINTQCIPFIIRAKMPNATTKAAIDEIPGMIASTDKYKRYATTEELFCDILKGDE